MHKLFFSILLIFSFSISGMQQQQRSLPTSHKVFQEVSSVAGGAVGGTVGFGLGAKAATLFTMTGCMPGVNIIALCAGGGVIVGYLAAKNSYNSLATKR